MRGQPYRGSVDMGVKSSDESTRRMRDLRKAPEKCPICKELVPVVRYRGQLRLKVHRIFIEGKRSRFSRRMPGSIRCEGSTLPVSRLRDPFSIDRLTAVLERLGLREWSTLEDAITQLSTMYLTIPAPEGVQPADLDEEQLAAVGVRMRGDMERYKRAFERNIAWIDEVIRVRREHAEKLDELQAKAAPLTIQELEWLAGSPNQNGWDAAERAIRDARDGFLPRDWHARVISSGMYLKTSRGWR